MLNLSVLLENSARQFPDKTAFIFADSAWSFSKINSLANQVANGLKASGIRRGDKVALTCVNAPFFPVIYFGILKAGGVVVPLSVLLKQDEVAYHLQNSDAKAYCCFVGTPELPMAQIGHAGFSQAPDCQHFFVITPKPDMPSPVEGAKTFWQLIAGKPGTFETVRTGAEDTAVIIYTSGTTGKPKGAALTHSNLLQNAILSGDLYAARHEDITLIVLPLFHIFAMSVMMNACMYKGMTAVLIPRFDAEAVLGAMLKHKVTVFAGVPTMYWGLLNYRGDLDVNAVADHLRICVSGGAALPVQVLKEFEAKFKVPILEGYGMSEGSPVVTFNQMHRERKPGSIGLPVWGVEVKLTDEKDRPVPPGEKGELCYRGHNVMKGYYKNPKATAQTIKNGWLHSGDVAVQDEDGYYYIVDRTKDMIIRGGFNVYPRELEEVMIKHEAVSIVAVIGVPHEQFGEEIKACVVLKPDASVSEQALIEWTKERLAAYKYPRIVQFMEALPMTATGKILKKELRSVSGD